MALHDFVEEVQVVGRRIRRWFEPGEFGAANYARFVNRATFLR